MFERVWATALWNKKKRVVISVRIKDKKEEESCFVPVWQIWSCPCLKDITVHCLVVGDWRISCRDVTPKKRCLRWLNGESSQWLLNLKTSWWCEGVFISLHICREARAEYIPVNKMKYQDYIRGDTNTLTTTQIDFFLDRQEEECIFLWKIN